MWLCDLMCAESYRVYTVLGYLHLKDLDRDGSKYWQSLISKIED
jgi:hypothetical protein